MIPETEAGLVQWAADATTLVAQCDSIERAQEASAQGDAALAYVKQKLGTSSLQYRTVAEVRLRWRHRLGELLPPAEKPEESGVRGGRGRKGSEPRTPLLDKRRASEARTLATLAPADLDDYFDACRERAKAPTVSGLMRLTQAPVTPEPMTHLQQVVERMSAALTVLRRAYTSVSDDEWECPEAKSFLLSLREPMTSLETSLMKARTSS